jgi:hypothetical protein
LGQHFQEKNFVASFRSGSIRKKFIWKFLNCSFFFFPVFIWGCFESIQNDIYLVALHTFSVHLCERDEPIGTFGEVGNDNEWVE